MIKLKINKKVKSALQWFLVFFIAIVIALILRIFFFASFKIPTPSMEPAILTGDFIIVSKLTPGPRIFENLDFFNDESIKRVRVKKVKRNDVLVFNFPYTNDNWDKIKMDINVYYAKRCVAIPGDTFYIENGISKVKGFSDTLGYYPFQKKISEKTPENTSADIYNTFPYNSYFNWNIKNFGPLYIPAKGDILAIDTFNIILYKKLIEYETGEYIKIDSSGIYLNNKLLTEYSFEQNYYFMTGDYALDSNDSRYWGLLPEKHIVGKAVIVWKSKDMHTNKTRWNRIFKLVK